MKTFKQPVTKSKRNLGSQQKLPPKKTALYRRAEARIASQHRQQPPETVPPRLLHELQVHQIELEMQNEELRKARDEMEAGLEKYSDLYDFAPISYLTLDPEGNVAEANLACASLLGVNRAALVGRRFGTFVFPAEHTGYTAFLQQAFQCKTKQECDMRLLVKGNLTVDVRIRAIASRSGKACRVALVDVTDQKRLANKMRVSEVRYRRLFEAAHDGVLLLDPETRKIADANPFMTKLLGYPNAQLIGKELFEIGLLKDEVASQEMFQKLKRQHEVRYENLPLESREGRHQEVEVVANLYLEDGHAVIQCNIRDITVRKAAEQALRASEERYRILFESGPVAVYSCDALGIIQNFNSRAVELWGRKPKVGDTSERFCGSVKMFRPDGSHMPHKKCPMAELLNGKISTVQDAEVLVEQPNGSRLTCIVNIRPLKNERGEITGAINCFYDITERRRIEATQRRLAVLTASNTKLEAEIVRREAVEQALQKSQAKQSDLLAEARHMNEQMQQLSRQVLQAQESERKRISRELHDVIVQTLTGINVQLTSLRKDALHNIKGLDRNIVRTQELVEKSVASVHKFARELRPFALDDLGLIPALHSFMKEFAARTGVQAHLTAFAGVEKLDNTKRTILFRVVQEALVNVEKHAQATKVLVTIQERQEVVHLDVEDNGKSFKVERVLQARRGGRLGLLGMRERVEMVGGEFNIESTAGKGTTISAQVPAAKERGKRVSKSR